MTMPGHDPAGVLGERKARFLSDFRWRRWWPGALVVASTFFAYSATLRFGYIYDDTYLIISNNSIRSWRFLPVYFSGHIWSYVFPMGKFNSYRPLLSIWLRLNYQLFGLHPLGWHLTIVIAHVAVTYVVYRLAQTLTREPWMALAAGLLFGLHPVHAETISEAAWADQPLGTFFMVAAILAWWRSHVEQRNHQWQVASVAFAALALLSKETAMVLPLLISALAWIYWRNDGAVPNLPESESESSLRFRTALVAGGPYWAAVGAYVFLRLWAMKVFAYVLYAMPLSKALLSVPAVVAMYLRLLVWPVGLSCYYDTFYVSAPGWRDFGLPVLLLAGVCALMVFWRRRTGKSNPRDARALAFAFTWMVLTIIPVLNFRYLPKDEIVHDRYLYLPSVGFCILMAVGFRQLREALPQVSRRRPAVVVAAMVLFGLLGGATIRQTFFWTDEVTLRTRAHETAPHNISATFTLADVLRVDKRYGQAMEFYREVLQHDPEYGPAIFGMGMCYFGQGNYPEAVRYLVRTCSLMPAESDAFANLGMALLHLGRAREAEEALRAALLEFPHGKNYHLGLAMALEAQGRLGEARQEVLAGIAEDTQNVQAKELLRHLDQIMESSSAGPAGNPALKP